MNTEKFLGMVERGIIPPEAPNVMGAMASIKARRVCTERGMWAIVTLDWTQVLADWISQRKVLEIMAGAGWLAKALSYHHHVDVVATDSQEWDAHHTKMRRVYEVEALEAADAVIKYRDWADILLVSWPPYGDTAIVRACESWPNDKPIVYIGEAGHGCNAPEEFFEHFTDVQDAPSIPLPQWRGLRDRVFIGHYDKEVIQ